jgi:hypothetical protein
MIDLILFVRAIKRVPLLEALVQPTQQIGPIGPPFGAAFQAAPLVGRSHGHGLEKVRRGSVAATLDGVLRKLECSLRRRIVIGRQVKGRHGEDAFYKMGNAIDHLNASAVAELMTTSVSNEAMVIFRAFSLMVSLFTKTPE